MTERIGYIGLGTMGFPMVVNLARARHELLVYDILPDVVEEATALRPVQGAASPKAVAEGCRVIFTCLPSLSAVEAVYFGEDGILAGLQAGSVTCDCSTVLPELALRQHAAVEAKGGLHVDGPVLGGPEAARAAQLYPVLSGSTEAVQALLPYLPAISRGHRHVGPAGAASTYKVLHNGLGLTAAVAMAEAIAAVQLAGLDGQMFYDVVMEGRGIAATHFFQRQAKRMVAQDWAPSAFLDIAVKDTAVADELARSLGLDARMLSESARAFAEAQSAGLGREDVVAVAKSVAKRRLPGKS